MIHPVHDRLRLGRAMDAVCRLRAIAQAADTAVAFPPQRRTGKHHRDHIQAARARQRLQRFLRQLHLRPRASNIDHRSLARHSDRLFELAHRQVGIHRRREFRRQHDAIPAKRVEAGQCECHGEGAGTQIDDSVHAALVSDDAADLFDENRTGGFDRHAGQDCARCVPHHPRNTALRPGSDRHKQKGRYDDDDPGSSLSIHQAFSFCSRTEKTG